MSLIKKSQDVVVNKFKYLNELILINGDITKKELMFY